MTGGGRQRPRIRGLGRLALALAVATVATSSLAQNETVVDIPSRGQKVRALLLKPASPSASVILLAGGDGKLDLASDGRMAWGAENQLVRTRAAYARAGFNTLVPDIAADLKTPSGVVERYRFSPPHGRDVGALVQYMRGIKAPVVLVATSRGAVSAGNALAHASGPARPDALVMTAAMLVSVGGNHPHFQMAIGNDAGKARLPLLIVGHKRDQCRYTLPATIDQFKRWHRGKVDVVILDGPAGTGDPCEVRSAHGFAGIDEEVVATIANWIKQQNLSGR